MMQLSTPHEQLVARNQITQYSNNRFRSKCESSVLCKLEQFTLLARLAPKIEDIKPTAPRHAKARSSNKILTESFVRNFEVPQINTQIVSRNEGFAIAVNRSTKLR